MKILLTGATGYIGKRLLPALVDAGHHVVCCARDPERFNPPDAVKPNISVIQVDLLEEDSLDKIPNDIDGAYYLVHSMSYSKDYKELEQKSAVNFRNALSKTNVEHVIYLSGIVNEDELSEHLSSRKMVEDELKKGDYHFTTLRAGIIIGSGSASFEIIRDIVEKLPIMITPKWLKTKCQPIGVTDVIKFLNQSLFHEDTYDDSFDIGGPDILPYKDMLLGYAKVRGLQRKIFITPFMSPKFSSYWLYFVTSTSYRLAASLVDSMKVEVVASDSRLNEILGIQPISYEDALNKAFKKIQENAIVSSWRDSYMSSGLDYNLSDFIEVPTHGCFKDKRSAKYDDREKCLDRVWSIGGETGWYYGTWLWKIRGFLDQVVGGVGLNRGRTNLNKLFPGDTIDFWRVLYANKEEGRLLLFAEMKLDGDAWLEFKIEDDELHQTATYRPIGITGRLYWYSVLPFHFFIFNGMLRNLAQGKNINNN